jgi:Na+/pantothenate symporter
VHELRDKVLFHPQIAAAAIYLTEVMTSVDSSIGGALIVVSGELARQLYRKISRCNCCVE